MIGSLYAGISGLKVNTKAMSVIGDNIANVNTTGFKTSKVSFANIFSASLGSTENQIGRGVTLAGVNPVWDSGSLENTTSVTDLAVNGKGLFIVNNDDGSQLYTRAGKFDFDKDGNLTTQDGLTVQGYAIDANGDFAPELSDIALPSANSIPLATDEFLMGINLDSTAEVGDEYTNSLTVYDSLGNAIPLTLTFKNTATGKWTATPSIPASAGSVTSAAIQVTFDGNGNLTAPATDSVIQLTLTNGATSTQDITWDLYENGSTNGSLTGYSGASAASSQTQDGYASGSLQGVSVDEDGVFTGLYSNGTMTPFAQIALADFASYSGLAKMGSNLYSTSVNSGQATIGMPGSGSLGSVSPSSLEMSNVDLSDEFVQMITTQRAFQANSKVITTSDEILAELINIKR
ncbi:flagellar hook protein FlgE [Desulfosarcina sp. BuS5]|uniref:flagellar hook protein FlgE n=1 Tax=Desulfosarcina sp. BuS5 TaxID=933262 RepID=UPI0004888E2D|nr:flagellar hook protein FlgE [Desulfosarcina sp. BuS5]WDN90041.1 flagellar hook protein FlgE [Desulfosarcina sp. BuS5]